MSSEWEQHSLEQCMDAIIDYRGKTPRKVSRGIPLITAKIIKNGRILEPTEFIDPSDYDAWMTRGIPSPGDIVLTTEAPLGEVAQLDDRKVALAQRVITLSGKKNLLDNNFLKFLLQSSFVQDQLRGRATGTTVSGVKQSELRKITLKLPQFGEQKCIAHILGTLDDKIELNRKMSATLESITRTHFKSWFIDFDPVRAKMDGRWKKGQSLPGLSAELFDLFPSDLSETNSGAIPRGWSIGTLGTIAQEQRRGIATKDIASGTPYIGLEHMPRRNIALSEWGISDGLESNKLQFRAGEILFGKLRPYFHKVGVAPLDGVCSTDIVVLGPKVPVWRGFVLEHVSTEAFVGFTNANSTGTKMPRTSWADMTRYPCVCPNEELVSIFEAQSLPVLQKIVASIFEAKSLEQIRSAFLPRLISGDLRIQDANAFLRARGL